jgi:hypothetical protein
MKVIKCDIHKDEYKTICVTTIHQIVQNIVERNLARSKRMKR